MSDIFHDCALWAYYEAMKEGKQDDSEYVRKRAYALFEQDKSRGLSGSDEESA